MDVIFQGLRYFIIILIFVIITRFFMQLTNWIGKILGINKLVELLLGKMKQEL